MVQGKMTKYLFKIHDKILIHIKKIVTYEIKNVHSTKNSVYKKIIDQKDNIIQYVQNKIQYR